MYLQYAAERGIPGLLMVLWLIAWTVVDSARAICAAERPSCELFALHGAIAVTIGVLVGGCFEYNLGDSEVLMMFVCVIALAYAAVYRLATTPFRVREGQAELVAQPSGSPGDSTQANQATAWRLTARAARA
jgi:O-antigen ligase